MKLTVGEMWFRTAILDLLNCILKFVSFRKQFLRNFPKKCDTFFNLIRCSNNIIFQTVLLSYMHRIRPSFSCRVRCHVWLECCILIVTWIGRCKWWWCRRWWSEIWNARNATDCSVACWCATTSEWIEIARKQWWTAVWIIAGSGCVLYRGIACGCWKPCIALVVWLWIDSIQVWKTQTIQTIEKLRNMRARTEI